MYVNVNLKAPEEGEWTAKVAISEDGDVSYYGYEAKGDSLDQQLADWFEQGPPGRRVQISWDGSVWTAEVVSDQPDSVPEPIVESGPTVEQAVRSAMRAWVMQW